MKIIKFGGKSLANGEGINKVINIIKSSADNNEKIAVVLSARNGTTNQLQLLLDLAVQGADYSSEFLELKEYQTEPLHDIDYGIEFKQLKDILHGVRLTKDYSLKVKNKVLSYGELFSVKLVNELLHLSNVKSKIVDTRKLIVTNQSHDKEEVEESASRHNTIEYFKSINKNEVAIVTGFIAANKYKETTTLGRNGSNYTASLLANYLDADEVISYTHVDGIYTANPELVKDAKVIKNINYAEANEIASFGASILHANTISPLAAKNIPLTILNTFNDHNSGTTVDNKEIPDGIKSISTKREVSLISIEGKGLTGKRGIDARIFTSLSAINISGGIISQGSSERGVSFVIESIDSEKALTALKVEFRNELKDNDIHTITSNDDIAVVTVAGQNIIDFSSSLLYLKQNRIPIHLINNTISGNNISLVIDDSDVIKVINIIHSQIFGVVKSINIAIIGKGTVGGSLIDQIQAAKQNIEARKSIRLNIFAIAGSKKVIYNRNGITDNWRKQFESGDPTDDVTQSIIDFAKSNHLENLVAIDNTASTDFVLNYLQLIDSGFDLISSNKIANTQSYKKYKSIREESRKNGKTYLYETNVGAGLPIIDTIKVLHESGENITRIQGVFSGSLSYLFNSFSESDRPFSYFLEKAIKQGYTEPDPREDLSGNDVGRKLLILARELDLQNEFEDVTIENLIPEELRNWSKEKFLNNITAIDKYFDQLKSQLASDEVLRYVGDLSGDLQNNKATLTVKLIKASKNSALGNLTGIDSSIEIYTDSYGDNPITLIGAGAGAAVTARGVFGDLLRIAYRK